MSKNTPIAAHSLDRLNRFIEDSISEPSSLESDEENFGDMKQLMNSILSFRDDQSRAHECDLTSLRKCEDTIASLTKSDTLRNESEQMNQSLIDMSSVVSTLLSDIATLRHHYQLLPNELKPYMKRLKILTEREHYLQQAISIERHSQMLQQVLDTYIEEKDIQSLSDFQDLVTNIPERYIYLRNVAIERQKTFVELFRKAVGCQLETDLKEAGWPSMLHSEKESQIAKSFENVMKVQYSGNVTKERAMHEIWAVKELSKAISTRFFYHFCRAESLTNDLRRPEWYMKYIMEQTAQHGEFLTKCIGPILAKYQSYLLCTDSINLFLRELIVTCKSKIQQDLSVLIAGDRAIYCHTLDEILLVEGNLDAEYGYGEWSEIDRMFFLRCIDTFTDSERTMFAWAQSDETYALQILEKFKDLSVESERNKKFGMWVAEEYEAFQDLADMGNSALVIVPPIALTVVGLLDFLCQRTVYMKSDEFRYFYATHVHYKVIDWFYMACKSSFESLQLQDALSRSWDCVSEKFMVWCAILTSADHILQTLHRWEKSMFFIGMTDRLQESSASRNRIFQYHINYTKSAITQVAKAASEAVMNREEAVAVRQAITGAGSVIGPTAAFSAAYSAGSKTVLSLFNRLQDNEYKQISNRHESPDDISAASPEHTEDLKNTAVSDITADDVLANFIFEDKIAALEGLVQTMMNTVTSGILKSIRQELDAYRNSSFWFEAVTASDTVSSEIAKSITLCQQFLRLTVRQLPKRIYRQLSRIIADEIDTSLVNCVMRLYEDIKRYNSAQRRQSLSFVEMDDAFGNVTAAACAQFAHDVEAWTKVWSITTTDMATVLQRARAMGRLFLMEPRKLTDIVSILSCELALDEVEQEVPDQITTIIEASGLNPLSPQQVYQLRSFLMQVD